MAKAENKPSSVPFDTQMGTQGDDHQSGMPIARHLKRPTRKLPPAIGGRRRRAASPSLFGLALEWGLPIPVLPRERVVSYTTFSPLPLNPAKGGTRRRSFFCGTFRPLRALGLRGTLPWRARTFLPRLWRGRSSILLWQI